MLDGAGGETGRDGRRARAPFGATGGHMRATIRTITLGIGDPHPLTEGTIARASDFLRAARARAEAAGYTIQTTRVATRPLLADLAASPDDAILAYAQRLQAACDQHGLGYCSLGPAP